MDLSPELRRETYSEVDGREEGAVLPLVVECLLSARTADAVFVVDPDYRIVHWDPRAEALTGLLSEDVLGRRCSAVLRGESGGACRLCGRECPLMGLAQAGRMVTSCDLRVNTRLGGKRWVNVSVLAVDTDDGVYLVHLMRDAQTAHEVLEMARGLIRLSEGRDPAQAQERQSATKLTPRQAEVLALLAEGKSVRDICEGLYLSKATVRNHVRALLQTLGAHTQLEAVAVARKMGLLPD